MTWAQDQRIAYIKDLTVGDFRRAAATEVTDVG